MSNLTISTATKDVRRGLKAQYWPFSPLIKKEIVEVVTLRKNRGYYCLQVVSHNEIKFKMVQFVIWQWLKSWDRKSHSWWEDSYSSFNPDPDGQKTCYMTVSWKKSGLQNRNKKNEKLWYELDKYLCSDSDSD